MGMFDWFSTTARKSNAAARIQLPFKVFHAVKRGVATTALGLTVASHAAQTGQFETIIDAMLIPVKAPQTNNNWDSTQKITGVKWDWPWHQSGSHENKMVGTTKVGKNKNPNIGATTVTIEGGRTFVDQIHVVVSNEESNISEFGNAKVTKLKTSCDQEDTGMTVAVFRYERTGFKPLFLSYESSWGTSGTGTVDWGATNDVDTALEVAPGCKILN